MRALVGAANGSLFLRMKSIDATSDAAYLRAVQGGAGMEPQRSHGAFDKNICRGENAGRLLGKPEPRRQTSRVGRRRPYSALRTHLGLR